MMGKALTERDESLVRCALTALNHPSVQSSLVSFVVYYERREHLKVEFPQYANELPKMSGIFQYRNKDRLSALIWESRISPISKHISDALSLVWFWILEEPPLPVCLQL